MHRTKVTIEPGDFLLYRSSTWIGWLIKTLDGTEYSHAGIYLGNDHVGEALLADTLGVNANPIRTSFENSDQSVVWESTSHVAPASLDELKAEAAVFAQHLIQSHSNVALESDRGSRSASDQLQDIIADFVTPGDLSKSPSLHRIGRVHGDGA